MANTMNIFASTLAIGGTIHNKSVARITGDKVGADNYVAWKSAMTTAHEKFYRYAHAVDSVAHGKTADVAGAKTAGMNAFQAILDIIGAINGFTIMKSEELFAEVVKYSVREATELSGEAFRVASVIKNLKAELKNTNGAREEWLEAKERELEEAEKELKTLKKTAGSGKPVDKIASYNSFCANFERKLAKLASEQSMKSYEEIEAEREEKRKARRAATKAKREAKKAAEANANA